MTLKKTTIRIPRIPAIIGMSQLFVLAIVSGTAWTAFSRLGFTGNVPTGALGYKLLVYASATMYAWLAWTAVAYFIEEAARHFFGPIRRFEAAHRRELLPIRVKVQSRVRGVDPYLLFITTSVTSILVESIVLKSSSLLYAIPICTVLGFMIEVWRKAALLEVLDLPAIPRGSSTVGSKPPCESIGGKAAPGRRRKSGR